MHLRSTITRLAVIGGFAASAFVVGGGTASADNAPTQACGNTQPGPCSETDHFTNETAWENPLGATSSSCPSWIINDFAFVDMTGQGVEHVTANRAQDFWFTSTFTGSGTVTFYPPSSVANVVTNENGDIISADIVGPSDGTVSGKLTNWFGISGNNKNFTSTGTINFAGTDAAGNPFNVHDTQHASSTGSDPFEPHLAFNSATC